MFLDHFLGENGLFHQIDPTNPPSVIHGWKATDLLYELVKRKNYFLNPISSQNYADAFAVTHNLKLEVCRIPPVSVYLIRHYLGDHHTEIIE